MTTAQQKKKTPVKSKAPANGKRRKPKRHLNPVAVALLAAIVLVIYAIFALPRTITNSKLRKLGYDKEAIAEIRNQKLTKTILLEGYYSDYLSSAIKKGTLNKDYIELYTVVSADSPLDAEDFLLYNRLADKGYEPDQLLNLFKQLQYSEITPLLVYDWQWDETDYIEDCIHIRAGLTEEEQKEADKKGNPYRRKYKFTSAACSPESTDTLVNFTYSLPEDYVPENLTDLSREVAVNGMSLRAEAAEAADEMVHASVNAGVPFFITVSYNSWSDQKYAYDLQLVRMSEDQADQVCIRPGYSEHQLGLAINVVPTYEKGAFEETQVYEWLSKNAEKYGFIQRYPSSQERITGMDEEENHYRYLGTELAKKFNASGLSYDEYYLLYLKPWDHEAQIPAESILTSTGCNAQLSGAPAPEPVKPEAGSASSEENPDSSSSADSE